MNIFVLDEDHAKCAEYHCDKHVGKMILESCQLLSTAHHVIDKGSAKEGIYKATHIWHPCAVWCRETINNYLWLYDLTNHLSKEFTKRFGKVHLSWKKLERLLQIPPKRMFDNATAKTFNPTPHPLCMPDEYKVENDAVQSYRNYYVNEKKDFAQWNHSETPDWWRDVNSTTMLKGFQTV